MAAKNLLLLRGLIREKRHWGDFIELAQKTFPNHNIICLDIPGNGELYQMSSLLSIKKNVQFLRERFLRLTKPGDENCILSISLGGMLTMCWLQNYPDDFKKALILNSSFGGFSPFYRRLKPKACSQFLKVSLSVKNAEKKHGLIFDLVANTHPGKEKIIPWWIALDETAKVSIPNAARQLFAAATYRPKKIKPKTQITVLVSRTDKLCDSRCSEDLANKWSLPIHIHPTAGHEMTLDDGQWVCDRAQEFFGK